MPSGDTSAPVMIVPGKQPGADRIVVRRQRERRDLLQRDVGAVDELAPCARNTLPIAARVLLVDHEEVAAAGVDERVTRRRRGDRDSATRTSRFPSGCRRRRREPRSVRVLGRRRSGCAPRRCRRCRRRRGSSCPPSDRDRARCPPSRRSSRRRRVYAPSSLPSGEIAYTVGSPPESLWTHRSGGCTRLATTPDTSLSTGSWSVGAGSGDAVEARTDRGRLHLGQLA